MTSHEPSNRRWTGSQYIQSNQYLSASSTEKIFQFPWSTSGSTLKWNCVEGNGAGAEEGEGVATASPGLEPLAIKRVRSGDWETCKVAFDSIMWWKPAKDDWVIIEFLSVQSLGEQAQTIDWRRFLLDVIVIRNWKTTQPWIQSMSVATVPSDFQQHGGPTSIWRDMYCSLLKRDDTYVRIPRTTAPSGILSPSSKPHYWAQNETQVGD